MANFKTSIDITSGGTFELDIYNGESSAQVAEDLNGKMRKIQTYLQEKLPEVYTTSTLPTNLPYGKLIVYNNELYFGNNSKVATKVGSGGTTSGILPINKGGTGADTAPAALTNLGAFPSAGGTISGNTTIAGNLTLKGSGNYGNKINFGDNDYVHLYENSDNNLEIKANNVNFVVSGKVTKNGTEIGSGSSGSSGGSGSSSDLSFDNPVFTGSVSMDRKSGTTVGEKSVALGAYLEASGASSSAFGNGTQASGDCSHAEGCNTKALGDYSHAEGMGGGTHTDALYAHSEGKGTTAYGEASHAEGLTTIAYGNGSHAEGGSRTERNAHYAHAEGNSTASGNSSHAEGSQTESSGINSHAEGCYTISSNYASHACGKCNKTMATGATLATSTGDAFVVGNGTGTGTNTLNMQVSRSNAFRVTYTGLVYGCSSFKTSGADYAEYFEWLDGNPNNEDRVGLFVTTQSNKIKIAQPNDYILGIVSGQPCIIGNADEDWMGRWQHDEYGRFILEYLEDEEMEIEIPVNNMNRDSINKLRMEPNVIEKDGKFYRVTTKVVDHPTSSYRFKANTEYDPTQPYVERKDRPEWDAVGMVGVLSVKDDGTCIPNGFCKVTDNGIATFTEKEFTIQDGEIIKGYRVVQRVNDNIIKVVLK